MTAIPVIRAVLGGLSGRRVQAIVIGVVVLMSTAASTLALGVLIDSNAPFDHAFAAQHGADVAVTVTGASTAQLTATTHLPGVTAAAGPYPETTVDVSRPVKLPSHSGSHSGSLVTVHQQLTLVGRSSPGGPADDLTLTSGHWVERPGQVVLSGRFGALSGGVGSQITVTGVRGSPKLAVVGVATSVTGTAQGWVTSAEMGMLHAAGAPRVSQMLYRFSSAGTTATVNADIAAVIAALPRGSVLGAQSYLTAKTQETRAIGPWVPFIAAFGLIGLVMSVLIVVNVVSGAVSAGVRRIGVLKSIGFSPTQVAAAYVLQVTVPALVGCLAGAVAGGLLARPALGQAAQVYGVGTLAVPLWADVGVPLVMLGLTGGTAMAIAVRAGRMSAVQAIATGRAPRPSHGYRAHRLLGRAHTLPRPVSIGLAGSFARPARTLVMLAAIVSGATAVIFAFGLSASLNRVQADLSHTASEQVRVLLAARKGPVVVRGQGQATMSVAAQEHAVQAALRGQPATLRYVAQANGLVSVPGLSDRLSLTGFAGDGGWTGYAIISGHWYSGPRQVDVNTAFLDDTGTTVGELYTLIAGGKHVTVRIAGEVFEPAGGSPEMLGSTATLSSVDPGLSPSLYQVGLKPGADVGAYVSAVGSELGPGYQVSIDDSGASVISAMLGLVATLTLVLAFVAGFGVLNTVVLQTRERVHDLGVFKAIGMTPRQTVTMVMSSVAGVGLAAGLLAIPAGVAVHRLVLPLMGHAVRTSLPPSVLDVYHGPELILLAGSGLVIALAGALAPASWAARARTALALRAE